MIDSEDPSPPANGNPRRASKVAINTAFDFWRLPQAQPTPTPVDKAIIRAIDERPELVEALNDVIDEDGHLSDLGIIQVITTLFGDSLDDEVQHTHLVDGVEKVCTKMTCDFWIWHDPVVKDAIPGRLETAIGKNMLNLIMGMLVTIRETQKREVGAELKLGKRRIRIRRLIALIIAIASAPTVISVATGAFPWLNVIWWLQLLGFIG